MASLNIDTNIILGNIKKLNELLGKYNIQWSIIMKVLSGDRKVLEAILNSEELQNIHSIGDSHLSCLKKIKQIRPDAVTLYIKPPAIDQVKNVISYADISLNSSIRTIEALNKEAKKQDKVHKIIVMIELGELREGVVREQILDFYKKVFKLSNIEVIGIGANLGCMYGIEPTFDKLIQLCLYKKIIELTFKKKIDLVSGGSSITLPLVGKGKRPQEVNHFRIGEAVFFGTSPFTNKRFRNLSTKGFEFKANIIEIAEKDTVPDGKIGEGNVGTVADTNSDRDKAYRAVVDFGILDVDVNDLTPSDKNISFAGTTSDMTVYDVGENKGKGGKQKYHVGDQLIFKPNYMAVARLMNTPFIEKKIT
jgi:predicted amino acid racemase